VGRLVFIGTKCYVSRETAIDVCTVTCYATNHVTVDARKCEKGHGQTIVEKLIRRECSFCGRAFWAYRADARYCSGRCRTRTLRWRGRLPAAEARAIKAMVEAASYLSYGDSREMGVSTLLRLKKKLQSLLDKNGVQTIS